MPEAPDCSNDLATKELWNSCRSSNLAKLTQGSSHGGLPSASDCHGSLNGVGDFDSWQGGSVMVVQMTKLLGVYEITKPPGVREIAE
jgi:hypothetical protein